MHPSLFVKVINGAEHSHAVADALVSVENRARYLAQSKATRDGDRAELPERAPLRLFVFHYED